MRFIKVTDGSDEIRINARHVVAVESYYDPDFGSDKRTLITVVDHTHHIVDQSLAEVMRQLEGASL